MWQQDDDAADDHFMRFGFDAAASNVTYSNAYFTLTKSVVKDVRSQNSL